MASNNSKHENRQKCFMRRGRAEKMSTVYKQSNVKEKACIIYIRNGIMNVDICA